MRFPVQSVTAMGALAMTGSLLLGISGDGPQSSVGVDIEFFPKAPRDDQLSDDERGAVNKPELERNEEETKLVKRATKEMETNDDYHGDRHEEERASTHRMAPKGARTLKPPKPHAGGGGGAGGGGSF